LLSTLKAYFLGKKELFEGLAIWQYRKFYESYASEFKLTGNGTAEDALKQIDDKGYLIPFTAENKN